MSALPTPRLLTFEEFERLPDPPGGYYELRHGEAVLVTFPSNDHKALQRCLRKFFEDLLEDMGVVDTEFPYRPFPEHEAWSADVAFVSQARYDTIVRGKCLIGSPELVVEVKSPTNTTKELNDKAMTALAGGAIVFWLVNPEDFTVTVYHHRQGMHVYESNDLVPFELGGVSAKISVNDIFAPIRG